MQHTNRRNPILPSTTVPTARRIPWFNSAIAWLNVRNIIADLFILIPSASYSRCSIGSIITWAVAQTEDDLSTRLTKISFHLISTMSDIHYYHHGRFRVSGGVIPDAITAYCTYGDPSKPCVVFPTCYGGKLDSE